MKIIILPEKEMELFQNDRRLLDHLFYFNFCDMRALTLILFIMNKTITWLYVSPLFLEFWAEFATILIP
jgi:hypothetical protein